MLRHIFQLDTECIFISLVLWNLKLRTWASTFSGFHFACDLAQQKCYLYLSKSVSSYSFLLNWCMHHRAMSSSSTISALRNIFGREGNGNWRKRKKVFKNSGKHRFLLLLSYAFKYDCFHLETKPFCSATSSEPSKIDRN